MTDPLNNWETQLYKGILELYVLEILAEKDAYGGEILQKLQTFGLNIPEGTLYPLLNRMQKNGLLESHWQAPKLSGHPRRYYNLNENSRILIPLMQQKFSALIAAHPAEGDNHE